MAVEEREDLAANGSRLKSFAPVPAALDHVQRRINARRSKPLMQTLALLQWHTPILIPMHDQERGLAGTQVQKRG